MKKLFGVVPAMTTPFDRNGRVQLDLVREHTEFLISKGVHGLYPLGTTGEMLRVSLEDRKLVAEEVVRTANGLVNVFIHVGSVLEEESIELAQHAEEVGADGIGVVTPLYFNANDKEIVEYFVRVANSVSEDFPVYLYNIPQCASNDLSAEAAENVQKRCKNVIGVKYSFPDLHLMNEYLAINDHNFSVVPGTDQLFLPTLAMGCDGVISGVSSVFPEPFVGVYNAFKENNIEKAREQQRIANVFCNELLAGANMSYFKEALKYRGINAGYMKAPQLDIEGEELDKLHQKLDETSKLL